MLSGDPLCDGEPQACATLRTAVSLVDAVKAFENFTLLVLGNADSGILRPLTAGCPPWTQATIAPSPGRRSELKRVVEKDVDQTVEQRFVTHDEGIGIVDTGGKLQPSD